MIADTIVPKLKCLVQIRCYIVTERRGGASVCWGVCLLNYRITKGKGNKVDMSFNGGAAVADPGLDIEATNQERGTPRTLSSKHRDSFLPHD